MTEARAAGRRFLSLLRLQIGGRWALFLAADALLLGAGLFDALVGERDSASALYVYVVLAPALLLGIPALSDLVALERDAGTLDLLLSVPRAGRELLQRGLLVATLMLAQAWLVLVASWLFGEHAFALLPALTHSAAAFTLVTAAALFWATRLESAGAAGTATLTTALALAPWFFDTPTDPVASAGGNAWLPGAEAALAIAADVGVLLGVAGLLMLAARRRLVRPELLLR